MSEIFTNDEIDQLLTAISTGELDDDKIIKTTKKMRKFCSKGNCSNCSFVNETEEKVVTCKYDKVELFLMG